MTGVQTCALPIYTPENRAKFLAGIPLGRFSLPSDIANAALFLADPASAFITGVGSKSTAGAASSVYDVIV